MLRDLNDRVGLSLYFSTFLDLFLVFDAVIVGMDMLIKKYGHTNKGKQRLCLVTDAKHPIKAPNEGTKEDQVCIVCQQMQDHGMKLDCIVIRENSGETAHRQILDENDYLLKQFSQKTKAKAIYVSNTTALLGALRTRNISPVTVFRGDLEISSTMKIKVRLQRTIFFTIETNDTFLHFSVLVLFQMIFFWSFSG